MQELFLYIHPGLRDSDLPTMHISLGSHHPKVVTTQSPPIRYNHIQRKHFRGTLVGLGHIDVFFSWGGLCVCGGGGGFFWGGGGWGLGGSFICTNANCSKT